MNILMVILAGSLLAHADKQKSDQQEVLCYEKMLEASIAYPDGGSILKRGDVKALVLPMKNGRGFFQFAKDGPQSCNPESDKSFSSSKMANYITEADKFKIRIEGEAFYVDMWREMNPKKEQISHKSTLMSIVEQEAESKLYKSVSQDYKAPICEPSSKGADEELKAVLLARLRTLRALLEFRLSKNDGRSPGVQKYIAALNACDQTLIQNDVRKITTVMLKGPPTKTPDLPASERLFNDANPSLTSPNP